MTRLIGLALYALLLLAPPLVAEDSVGVTTEAIRLSEPVAQTNTSETFGALLDDSVPAVSLADVVTSGDDYVGQSVRVEARVSQVCRKKGCFFIAAEGDAVVRVSFVDYSFFVPTDISGKHVTFVGEVIAKDVTEAEAEHFAEDIGDDAAHVRPGRTFEIVATAVRIPRSN